MTNAVGTRAVFGVVVPSTNTVVEHDYWRAGLPGIAFRAGSMYIPNPVMGDDADFQALLVQIRASIDTAVRDVLTAEPERMVMGMSAETFWGGVAGNAAFGQRLRDRTGLPVTTGASSCRAALHELGCRRIAVFSPYQPIADREVGRFFTEAGFDVAAITGLRCPSAMAIARVGDDRLREVVTAPRRPGCPGDRAGRHQPVLRRTRRSPRSGTGQTRDRHQCRHPVVRPARPRFRRSHRGRGSPPARTLNRSCEPLVPAEIDAVSTGSASPTR